VIEHADLLAVRSLALDPVVGPPSAMSTVSSANH
jgi:hypothetical protein